MKSVILIFICIFIYVSDCKYSMVIMIYIYKIIDSIYNMKVHSNDY